MKLKIFTLFFLAPLISSAASIIYLGPVGPYGPDNLLVDGIPELGTCVNIDLPILPTWVADLVPISALPLADQKTYLEAEWLNEQFAKDSDWMGIHHGIWNLFSTNFADGQPWDILAAANYTSVDPKSFAILIPDPRYVVQVLLIQFPSNEAPEPATGMMIAIGVILVACAFGIRTYRKITGPGS
jgi:hypothetical protein